MTFPQIFKLAFRTLLRDVLNLGRGNPQDSDSVASERPPEVPKPRKVVVFIPPNPKDDA